MVHIIMMAVAFFCGIILGSVTMSWFSDAKTARIVDMAVINALHWVERMYNRGKLPEALAETFEKWNEDEEERNATN